VTEIDQDWWRTLLLSLPESVFFKNRDSVYLACNERFARQFGLDAATVVGKDDYALFPGATAKRLRADDARLMASGLVAEVETEQADAAGRQWTRTTRTAVRNAKGEIIGVLGVMRDATADYGAEVLLATAARDWQTTFDAIQDPLCILDGTHTVHRCNRAMAQLIGKDAADLIGHRCNDLVHGGPPVPGCPLRAAVRSQRRETMPLQWDGRSLLVTVDPVVETGQATARYVHIITDLTDQVKAREAAATREARLDSILRAAPAGIGVVDGERRFVEVNDYLSAMTGYSRGELLGQSTRVLYPDDEEWARAERALYEQLRTTGSAEVEARYRRRDGSVHEMSVSMSPVAADDAGQGSTFVAIDTTQRKRARQEAHRLNADLEQRVNERTAELQAAVESIESFSYSVSHDLRAPLRAISGYASLLLQDHSTTLSSEARLYASRLNAAAIRSGDLVDALLAFSHLGRAPLRTEDVNLNALVTDALIELGETMERRDVTLEIETLPSCRGDETLLRRVFVNLLSNALKFTREREKAVVRLGARREGDEILVFVADNGIGFDPASADRAFAVFDRLHADLGYEGIGIGLANVKRIVEKHGGRVWAEACEGEGATFWFSLPVGAEQPSH